MRSSCLDEMQLACDPSDPSLQFRVSNNQIHSWVRSTCTAARKAAEENEKKTAASEHHNQQNLPKDSGESAAMSASTAPPTTSSLLSTAALPGVTNLAAISCALRRLRLFSSAATTSSMAVVASPSSPNTKVLGGGGGMSSAAAGGAGGPGTPVSPASPLIAGGGGGGGGGLPTTSSTGSGLDEQGSAGRGGSQQLLRHHNSTQHHSSGHTTTQLGAPNNLIPVDDAALETLRHIATLPFATPLVDVEICRTLARVEDDSRDVVRYPILLDSKLHRQLLRRVRSHPLSSVLEVPSSPGNNTAASETTQSVDHNTKHKSDDDNIHTGTTDATTMTMMMTEVSIVDVVHGRRIRIPVRSEYCRAADHGPTCLLSYFMLALQTGSIVGRTSDMMMMTTGGGGGLGAGLGGGEQQQQHFSRQQKQQSNQQNINCNDSDIVFALCPHCQAPVTLGSLYVDRFMDCVLLAVPPPPLSSQQQQQQQEDVRSVVVDVSNFPNTLRVIPPSSSSGDANEPETPNVMTTAADSVSQSRRRQRDD